MSANRLLVFCVLALLVGCASAPESPPLPRVVTVEMPIVQPCPVKVPEQQVYAAEKLSLASSDFEKIKAVLVERKQRAAAEKELRRLLGVCVTPP